MNRLGRAGCVTVLSLVSVACEGSTPVWGAGALPDATPVPSNEAGDARAEDAAETGHRVDAPETDAPRESDVEDSEEDSAYETVCADLATTMCNRLTDCTPFAERLLFSSATTCAARLKLSCVLSLRAPSVLETSDDVRACQKAYADAACGDLLANHAPEACGPVKGSLSDGGSCVVDEQCQSAFCQFDSAASCGACARRPAKGDTCSGERDDECEAGLVCNVNHHCASPIALGDPCNDENPCLRLYACQDGTCATPEEGSTCAGASDCSQWMGFFCSGGSCKKATVAASGAACGLVDDTPTACGGAGHCKDTCMAPASDGSHCDSDQGPDCVFPAVCLAGTCRVRASLSCH